VLSHWRTELGFPDDLTGDAFHGYYEQVEQELTARFGGLTAYARAPAKGLWSKQPGHETRDDIVVYEVMVEPLDSSWWAAYRLDLEQRFGQEELVVRAQPIERI